MKLDLAKTNELPYALLELVRDHGHDLDTLEAELEFGYPDLEFTRSNLRKLVKHVVRENELDQESRNPTTTDPMIGAIDRVMSKEILRMTDRVDLLSDIAKEPPGTPCLIEDTEERLTPQMAKEELIGLQSRLMEMKKSLVDQQKVEKMGADVNVNIDMGGIMTAALDNIKKMELPVEARVVE